MITHCVQVNKLILDFVILCMSYTELNLLTKMELDSVTHCTNTTMAQLLLRKWFGSLKEGWEFMTGCSHIHDLQLSCLILCFKTFTND